MELSHLPEEVLCFMLHQLPLCDLCTLGESSLFWYRITGDDLLWMIKCRDKWCDKQNQAFTRQRADELWASQKKWKLIYFQAEKESVNQQIDMEILCNNVWDFKFVGESDPRTEYRVFGRDFKYPLSRMGNLSWCFAACKDGHLGVQLEEFAVMRPERTPDWGWKLSNGQFILKSLQRDPNMDSIEKMAESNRQRFAYPPIRMVPIIFRLAGHTFIIHAALENDYPTEEQKQEIVTRVVTHLLLRGNLQRMLRRHYRNRGLLGGDEDIENNNDNEADNDNNNDNNNDPPLEDHEDGLPPLIDEDPVRPNDQVNTHNEQQELPLDQDPLPWTDDIVQTDQPSDYIDPNNEPGQDSEPNIQLDAPRQDNEPVLNV